jgi:hypothetical protein
MTSNNGKDPRSVELPADDPLGSDRPLSFREDENMSNTFIMVCDPVPRLVPKPKRTTPLCAGLFGLRFPLERSSPSSRTRPGRDC